MKSNEICIYSLKLIIIGLMEIPNSFNEINTEDHYCGKYLNSQFHYWLEDIAHGGCIINRLRENNYYSNMEAPWHQVYAIEAASYILHETQPHGCLTSSKSSHSNRKCFCPLGRTVDVTHLPVYACECIMDVAFFTWLITR